MTETVLKKESQDSESVPSPEGTTAIQSVLDVRTTTELNQTLALMERRATDLVACDVVREGYMAHGHPAVLGFQHLSAMTISRLKKRFPLFDRSQPLFRILWVQGRVIVGEELVKKYEARRSGKTYDYTKSIDKRFKKMFDELQQYQEVLHSIAYEEKK